MIPLTIWNFIKAHGSTILLVVVLVVGYGMFRRNDAGWAATVSKLNASHQQEISKIIDDKKVEEEEHAAEVKTLHDTLDKVQKAYDDATTAVVHQETVEEHAIVKKYTNDNVGLAELVADKFGLAVQK